MSVPRRKGPQEQPPPLQEQSFKTLAAPGLDEDDLFAAMHGLPGKGALWGDPGQPRPQGFPPPSEEERWDPETERRRRHRDLLDRWDPADDPTA
jgi:hypothetical protein